MARKPNFPDATLRGSLNDIFGAFDPETISYLGKFSRMGLEQDLTTSRKLGGQFQAERQRLMELDPLVKRLRNLSISGLKGLNQGALPADVQRSILDRVRASQAARGFEDSAGSIAAEAGALAGGAEQFRQSRMNQALAVGDRYNTAGQMLSGGVPSFSQLLAAQQNTLGLRTQQAQSSFDSVMGQYAQLGQAAGSIAGTIFGGPIGGMAGGAAGSQLFGGMGKPSGGGFTQFGMPFSMMGGGAGGPTPEQWGAVAGMGGFAGY